MLKTTQFKKYQLSELKQKDFKQIQLMVTKPDGQLYHIDYIRKVCKGKRSNLLIGNAAILYLEKLIAFEESIIGSDK